MAQKVITTENLNEVTAQEVFDYVTKKIIEQGEPSIDLERDTCVYSDGKLKCAAGHLIPSSMNTKKWDSNGYTWIQLVEQNLVPDVHCELISDLQRAHDNAGWASVKVENRGRFVPIVKDAFSVVATKYNLS